MADEEIKLDMTVSLEDYCTLMENTKALEALQAAGVDNWEGYDLAMEAASKDVRIGL
jgi:hypothetical protein